MPHDFIGLFRGLAGKTFSAGLDTISDEIPGSGVYAYGDGPEIAEQIAIAWDKGSINTVNLAGHSMGATAAVDVAAALESVQIPVANLVLLDLHAPRQLSHNVVRCLSVKQPNNIFIIKRFYHVEVPAGYQGTFKSIDADDVKAHHLLDDNPKYQDLLKRMVTGKEINFQNV